MHSRTACSRFGIAAAAVILFVSSSVYAQRGGGRGGGGTHSSSSGSHSGSRGSAGGLRGGSGSRSTIQGRSWSSSPPSFRNDRHFLPRERFFGSFGFGFPGYFGWDYGYSYFPSLPYVLIDPNAAAYQEVPWDVDEIAGNPDQADSYWLIALKDDSIILATDYWLEDSTLHYVTRSGKESSTDLSQVDLNLTKDLNRGLGREFQLPHARSNYQPPRRDEFGRPY